MVCPRAEVSEIRARALALYEDAVRQHALHHVADRAPVDDALAAFTTPGAGRGGATRATALAQAADLSLLLCPGRVVWVDLYGRRIAGVVKREVEYRRKFKIRISASGLNGELGGTKAVVEVQNMFFRRGRDFIPVLRFAQLLARGQLSSWLCPTKVPHNGT